MKYFACFLIFLSQCVFAGNIRDILVEKKEPATATCYIQTDPYVIGITIEVPYSRVAFLFNDTPVNEKETSPVWISYKEDLTVSHLIFKDKKVKAAVLRKEFIEKLVKLRDELQKKVS